MLDLTRVSTVDDIMKIWSHLVETRREISFISARSRLPAVKQQQASLCLQPQPLVMRVHPQPEDYRSDWMLWFDLPSAVSCARGDVKRQCLVVCFSNTTAPAKRCICVCLAPPMISYCSVWIYESWDIWVVRSYFKPHNISGSTFRRNSTGNCGATRNCICCLATIAYWTFYQKLLRSTGRESVVQRRNTL